MQNDLKYGKLSEICGINGYFMGKNRKKSHLRRQKFSPAGKEIRTYYLWNLQIKVRDHSPLLIAEDPKSGNDFIIAKYHLKNGVSQLRIITTARTLMEFVLASSFQGFIHCKLSMLGIVKTK